jgi:hypothetical protein
MNVVIREEEAIPCGQKCILEDTPEHHVINVHLMEMKVWETEVAGQTWEIKYTVWKKNILSR